MKIAIITALCGDREKLCNPPVIHQNADYFAFVDNKIEGTIWNQKETLNFTIDTRYKNRRNAKIYKILPFLFVPNYDYYIWHDVSHAVVENPETICTKYMEDNSFGFFKHTARNCVYQEAEELLKLGYDHTENIKRQMASYRNDGYPDNNGLFELSAFVLKNTKDVQETCLTWWELICRYASRDQLSLPYSLWKNKVTNQVAVFPGFSNGINSRGTWGNNTLIPQVRAHAGG